MKLIRIVHYRCSEVDCATYMMAPDEWSEDQIDEKLRDAQGKYLEAFELAKKDEKPPHESKDLYSYQVFAREENLDRTAREIIEERDRMRAERKVWQDKQWQTKKQFSSFLSEQGFISLWNDDVAEEYELDWSHRHGQRLDYDKNVSDPDKFPTPEKLAGTDNIFADDDD